MANFYDADGNIIDISTEGVVIHVGAGQDYTTLRSGIAEAILHNGAKVIVHAGTYDLTQEFAAEIASHTASQEAGIVLDNNVHVIFEAGSYVTAIFETTNAWIATYFQPFRGKNFILEGLNVEVKNCRYAVHDEQNGADVTYKNVYKNCIMKNTVATGSGVSENHYPQCIGGGLGKHGFIEIHGGKYTSIGVDTITNEGPAISYHNGNISGADSKIFIDGVYLDGTYGNLRIGDYGPSTIKSKVLVSNCSFGSAILHRYETSGQSVENFEITEWNNEVRS